MGISIDGYMMVGNFGENIKVPEGEELSEWYYDNDLDSCSPYYDSSPEEWIIGFRIENIPVEEMDEKWLEKIKETGKRFTELTGARAILFGAQDVN